MQIWFIYICNRRLLWYIVLYFISQLQYFVWIESFMCNLIFACGLWDTFRTTLTFFDSNRTVRSYLKSTFSLITTVDYMCFILLVSDCIARCFIRCSRFCLINFLILIVRPNRITRFLSNVSSTKLWLTSTRQFGLYASSIGCLKRFICYSIASFFFETNFLQYGYWLILIIA